MKITGVRTKLYEFTMKRPLGDAPGLGITFDEAQLDALAVERPSPGSGPSPWGRRRGAGLYEVSPDEPEEFDEE